MCAQTTRSQPVAHRVLHLVSEILGKRSFVCQKISDREPSLSASLCHIQYHTLTDSESTVGMRSDRTEERKREVVWFQELVALLLREILPHGPVQRKILG